MRGSGRGCGRDRDWHGVLAPKPQRAVTLAQAEAVTGAVGAEVLTVGVFVDATREEIDHVMRRVPLGAAQLHGERVAGVCRHGCRGR